MTAAEVMTGDPTTVRTDTSIKEVADLLVQQGFSGVPVLDEYGKLAGLVADADMTPSMGSVPLSTVKAPTLLSEFVNPDDPLEPYREARSTRLLM